MNETVSNRCKFMFVKTLTEYFVKLLVLILPSMFQKRLIFLHYFLPLKFFYTFDSFLSISCILAGCGVSWKNNTDITWWTIDSCCLVSRSESMFGNCIFRIDPVIRIHTIILSPNARDVKRVSFCQFRFTNAVITSELLMQKQLR